jgi:carbon-monoxide dehydrogenase iron sulfur subunit
MQYEEKDGNMSYVIIIDADKCSGCQMCEVACSLRNTKECNPERSRIRVIKTQLDGQLEFIPSTCMQCETAMCELVCPTGAISRHPETGARIISEKKCIGCSACSYACPFGACFVDRRLGKALVCSQCEGDPICVKVCPSGALSYTRADQVSITLKRGATQRLIMAREITREAAAMSEPSGNRDNC